MKRHIIIAACMALGLMVATPAALATQPWQQVSQGTWLNDVAYGAGRYVATGYTGIYTSTDGMTWQQATLPGAGTVDYHRILWNSAQNRFVTAGFYGAVLTSPDGLNWTAHPTGLLTVFSLILAGGQYVAVGEDASHVATSPDGITWTMHATPANGNDNLDGVAWNGAEYVAAGYCLSQSCPDGADIVLTSPDGAAWTLVDPGTTANPIYADGIAWGNGRFVVVGQTGVITSTDGNSWTPQPVDYNQVFSAASNNALRFDGSRFLATGVDYSTGQRMLAVFASSDGSSWDAHDVPDPYAADSLVTAVEQVGGNYFVTTADGSIFSTPDLGAWTTNRAGSVLGTDNYGGIAYGSGSYLTYVAPGPVRGLPTSSGYTSPDGITWSQQGTAGSLCWSMAYAASIFACTANVGGKLYTSPDESNWVTRTAGIGADTYVLDVLGTPGGFVAVGEDATGGNITSAVLTSPDGATWTAQPSAAVTGVSLSQVVAGAGGYYALGSHSDTADSQQVPDLLFSADGTAWSQLAPDWPGDFSPTALVANAGTLVAAGTNYRGLDVCMPGICRSEVFTSTDGTHWTQRDLSTLGIPDGTYWDGGATGGGLLELYGEAGGTNQVVFLSSHDGTQWDYTDLPSTFSASAPHGMLWSGTQFVTAVSQGGIFRLPGVSLSLSMVARSRVRTRRRFRYVLRVRNADASQAATGVTVTDRLPAGVQFLSAQIRRASGTCSASGQTVACTLSGSLAAGARARIVLRVRAPATPGTIVNEASAVSDSPVTDGSSSSASATTDVFCRGRRCH